MNSAPTDSEDELPVPFDEFLRDRYDPEDVDGLPIPFTEFVGPRSGRNAGHKLSKTRDPIFYWRDDWEVIDTSDEGYPTVVRNTSCDTALAATLASPHHATYDSALLGYEPDGGSFALGVVSRLHYVDDLFRSGIPCVADSCSVENIVSLLTAEDIDTPVAIVKGRRRYRADDNRVRYTTGSTAYVWYSGTGHEPRTVVERMQLDGYETLLERYETAADAIGWRFRHRRRDDYDRPEGVNPERAVDLMEEFDSFFQKSDR